MSDDVTVNENNGTVFVCVQRNVLTENPLTVPIAITQGSADCKYHPGNFTARNNVVILTLIPHGCYS